MMRLTDQFYSNISDREVQNRISGLGKTEKSKAKDDLDLIREFLEWKRSQKA